MIHKIYHTPNKPLANESMIVTVMLKQNLHKNQCVKLHYRVMYNKIVSLIMDQSDESPHNEQSRIFNAEIPTKIATEEEMIRYFVTIEENEAILSREPEFAKREGKKQSPSYFGTVVQAKEEQSKIPLFMWFTEDIRNAHHRRGTRASVFYNGEFYDNVSVRKRGHSNNKASQKFKFNKEHWLYVNKELGRVKEINLNSNGVDTSFIRQPLAFDLYREAGVASPVSFFMCVHVNGTYERLGIFVEQIDKQFLKRNKLSPDGALYKFNHRTGSNPDTPLLSEYKDGIVKKCRKREDRSDLKILVNGLNLPSAEKRRVFAYDHLDLSQIINYLAVRFITNDVDTIRKNFYMHCDTEGTGLWSILPWDKDFTFGLGAGMSVLGRHPFYGDQNYFWSDNHWNALFEVLFENPVICEMYLRRIRTLMDKFVKPVQAPPEQDWLIQHTNHLYSKAEDHFTDEQHKGLRDLKDLYQCLKNNLYVSHIVGGEDPDSAGIPETQEEDALVVVKDGDRYNAGTLILAGVSTFMQMLFGGWLGGGVFVRRLGLTR